MACLRDDESGGETGCWAASSSSSSMKVVSKRLSKINNNNNNNNNNGTSDEDEKNKLVMKYPFEKLFPVYVYAYARNDSPSVSDSGTTTTTTTHTLDADPIWHAITQDAKFQAENEPILCSILYANILAHDSLERSLCFVLANRLQNPTLLATQLIDIFSHVIFHDKSIHRSIRLDLQAFKDRDPACLSYTSSLLYMKGYHSLQSYRVAHALWNQGRVVLALALQSRISEVFGVDIHPAAKIGDGILLDHGTGVVIGETAVIGNQVSLMHGVTLGGTGKEVGDRHPKVGDSALLGARVTILGNIKVGDGAMIAAGSLVLKEVPSHSMVAGTPAQVIGFVNEQDPSLTMNHDATKEFFKHVAVSFREGRSNGEFSCAFHFRM
ncbi:hypothetical protein ACFE04_026327 [Oxalis oulophora]